MSQLYLVFDTETGDLDENVGDLLTAFFCIMDEDFKIIEELDLKLKPDGGRTPIATDGALKANGINIQEHLANPATITYSEGQAKVIDMVKRHLKKNGRFSNIIPMGYNILTFDIPWVQKHLIPKKVWLNLIHYKANDVMQTVDALKRYGWFPKTLGSLGTVVEYLGIPARAAHIAREDVLMTIDVEKKLTEIMKSKKEGGGSGAGQDLITLLEAE